VEVGIASGYPLEGKEGREAREKSDNPTSRYPFILG
jgi:hypothetical protein